VAIGLTLSSVVTMVFAELVPKNLAIARPMETARATQGFQRLFTAVMRVPIRLLNGSANALVRRLGLEPQEFAETRADRLEPRVLHRQVAKAVRPADDPGIREQCTHFLESLGGLLEAAAYGVLHQSRSSR